MRFQLRRFVYERSRRCEGAGGKGGEKREGSAEEDGGLIERRGVSEKDRQRHPNDVIRKVKNL